MCGLAVGLEVLLFASESLTKAIQRAPIVRFPQTLVHFRTRRRPWPP